MKCIKTLVILLFAMLLCGPVLTACSSGDPAVTEEEELLDIDAISYDAGEFTTNVSGSKKILLTSIEINLISQKLAEKLEADDKEVRDVINRELYKLTEQDLESADIMEKLSDSLTRALNEALNTKGFYKVYFTRFVYN